MARTADPTVRLALIDAAARILATDGAAALSIRKVAAAVETSTMAVYTHFGSKDELVLAVVAEAFDRLEADLRSVPQTGDPVVDLAAQGIAYRRNALENPDLYRVMFSLNPLALGPPAADSPGEVLGTGAFEALVEAVARVHSVLPLAAPPEQLAAQFWAMAHGVVSLELAGFLGDRGDETFAAMGNNLLAGILGQSEGPGA